MSPVRAQPKEYTKVQWTQLNIRLSILKNDLIEDLTLIGLTIIAE